MPVKHPDLQTAALPNGKTCSGDLAYMDEAGYFFVVDRKKDVINASGFKVWPREVEEVIYRHPLVQAAAVIGVPDSYRGETVKAVVVLKADHGYSTQDAAREEISAFCRLELAAYKVPRIMEFKEDLPTSAAGKVLRRLLREEPKDEP